MQRSKEEAEVIIRLDFMDQQAHICVSQWSAMASKMRKRYGPSRDPNSRFSERWTVPIKAISFRSPEKRSPKAIKRAVLASGPHCSSGLSVLSGSQASGSR